MKNKSENTIKVQLEVVPDDPRDFDPSELGDVGRFVSEALSSDGYAVHPAYSSEKGGTLFEVVQQLAHQVQANKEIIVALIGLVTPIVQYLFKIKERKLEEDKKQGESQRIGVTLAIDGAHITVDAKHANNVATLIEVFKSSHPEVAAKATVNSRVKITAKIAPKKGRRRR